MNSFSCILEKKYPYLLIATFGISEQLIWILKHYCKKKLSLAETTLRHVCL